MEKINKIIDSLSPVEQNIMYNALQKKLNRGPEYTIRKNGTGYSIKPNDKYENANHGTICSLVFETPEMARLAYAIYLNTQDSLVDIIDNIKYVFRLLNIDSDDEIYDYVFDVEFYEVSHELEVLLYKHNFDIDSVRIPAGVRKRLACFGKATD